MRKRQLVIVCLFLLASGSFLNGCPPDVSVTYSLDDYFPLHQNNQWSYVLHEIKYARCEDQTEATDTVYIDPNPLPMRLTIRVEELIDPDNPDTLESYRGVPAWKLKKSVVHDAGPALDEFFFFVVLGRNVAPEKQLPDLPESDDWGVLYEISEQNYLGLTIEQMVTYNKRHLAGMALPDMFERWERWTMFDAYERVSNLWWRFVKADNGALLLDQTAPPPIGLETWREVPLGPLNTFFDQTVLEDYGNQTLYDVLFTDGNGNNIPALRSDYTRAGIFGHDAWNVLREDVGPLVFQLDITDLFPGEEKAWSDLIADCDRRKAFAALIEMHLEESDSLPTASLTYNSVAGQDTLEAPAWGSNPVTPEMRLAPRYIQFIDQSLPGGSRIVRKEVDSNDGSIVVEEDGQFPVEPYTEPGLYQPELTVKTFIGDDFAYLSTADYVDVGDGLQPIESVTADQLEKAADSYAVAAYIEVTELPAASFEIVGRPEAADRTTANVQFQDTSDQGNSGRHPIDPNMDDPTSPAAVARGWAWDFESDGIVDSQDQNPQHTFPGPGCYQVSLTVTTAVGSNTWAEDLEVTELPEASFEVVDRTSPDQRLSATVTFNDTSDARNSGACGNYGITTWSWDFDGDGVEDSAGQHPTHTFPGPGCYPVTLTVTTAVGSDVSDVAYVEVTELPEASFELVDRAMASERLPSTVAFTDTSDALNPEACNQYPITGWSWDFDGDSDQDSTQQSPSWDYPGPGCYEVTLTVTSATGSDSFTDYVEVTELPAASFEIVGRTAAEERLSPTVSFLDTSVAGNADDCPGFDDYAITVWQWDFNNDGAPDSTEQNPTFTFPGPGCYPVTLTVATAAGSDTSEAVSVEVLELPAAAFDIVDRDTPDARLSATVAFADTSDAGNDAACSSYPITAWAWDFNNDGESDSTEQNPTWTFPGPGCYPVTLIVTTAPGEDSSGVVNVEVTELPVASFDIVGRETPDARLSATVDFADTSDARNGAACDNYPIVGWAWDFDNDGSADSTEQSPSWTFPGPGCYPVTLTVTSAVGQDASDVVDVEVTELPAASFAVFDRELQEDLLNPVVGFINSSDPRNGAACDDYPILSWDWDFDNDGTTDSTEQSPSWTFPGPGCYQVTLTVTSATGQDTSDAVTVEVTQLPEASFTVAGRETPAARIDPTVAFLDTSVAGAQGCIPYPVTAWAWDFNADGLTDSTNQNPTWTFPGPGCHPVTLTVTSGAGSDDASIEVEVTSLPEASFALVGRDTPLDQRDPTVVFADTSDPRATACGSSTILSWAWDFDSDGLTDSTEQNPTYTFSGPGCWPVTLTVTSEAGPDTSDVIDVAVTGDDVAQFSVIGRETPADRVDPTVSFLDASIAGNTRDCADYPITSWEWDFDGDGQIDSTDQNPTWTYPGSGCYPVTLTVTSGAGSDSSEIVYVEVLGPCESSFTVVGRLTPGERLDPVVTFLNSSTYGNEGACETYTVTNEWDFDADQVTDSTEDNPTWTFPGPGCYTVALTVSTDFGSCTSYLDVEVTELPTASFEANPTSGDTPLTVLFTDLSTAGNAAACTAYPITGWAWDLTGDGETDTTSQYPTWEYSFPGSYDITLTVYTEVGEHTLTRTAYVSVDNPI